MFWGPTGEQLVACRHFLASTWKASSARWKVQHTPLSLGKPTSLFEAILEAFHNGKFGDP